MDMDMDMDMGMYSTHIIVVCYITPQTALILSPPTLHITWMIALITQFVYLHLHVHGTETYMVQRHTWYRDVKYTCIYVYMAPNTPSKHSPKTYSQHHA